MIDYKNYNIGDFREAHKNHKLADVEQRRLKLATAQAAATLQAYNSLFKSFEEQEMVETPDYRKILLSGENLDKSSFIFDIRNYEADLKTYAMNYNENTDADFKNDNPEKTALVMEFLNGEEEVSLEAKVKLFVQMTKDMATFMVGRDNINKVIFPTKYAKDEPNFYLGGLKLTGFYNSYMNFMGGAEESTTKKVFRQLAKEASQIYAYNDKKMDYEYSLDGDTLNYQKLDSLGDPVDDFGMITSGVDKIMIQSKSGADLKINLPEGASYSRKVLERGTLYDTKEENGKVFMVVGDTLQPVLDSNLYYVIEGTPNFSVETTNANDIKIVEYMNDGSIYSQINSGLKGDELLSVVLGNSNSIESSMAKSVNEIGFQEFLFADHRENLDDVESFGAALEGVNDENTDKFIVTIGGIEGLTKNHIGSFMPSLYVKKSFLSAESGVNEANPNIDSKTPFWHSTIESIDVANTLRAFLQIEANKLADNNISEGVEKTQASVFLGSKLTYTHAINNFPDMEIPAERVIVQSTRDWKKDFDDRSFLDKIKNNENYIELAYQYFRYRLGEVVEAYKNFDNKVFPTLPSGQPDAAFSLDTIDRDAFDRLQKSFLSIEEQKVLFSLQKEPAFANDFFSPAKERVELKSLLAALGTIIHDLGEGKKVEKVFGNSRVTYTTNFVRYGEYKPFVNSNEIESLFVGGDNSAAPTKGKKGKDAEQTQTVAAPKNLIQTNNNLKYALLSLVAKINMCEQIGTPEDNKNITAGVKDRLINILTQTSNKTTGASFLDTIVAGNNYLQQRDTAMLIRELKKYSEKLNKVTTSAEVAIRKNESPYKKLDLSTNPEFAITALGLKTGDPMITFVVATGGVGKTEIANTLKLLNVIGVIGIENRDQDDPLNIQKMSNVSITDGKKMYKIHDIVYKNSIGDFVAGAGVAVADELVETISAWLASREVGTGPKVDAMNKASGREAMISVDLGGLTNKYFNNGMIAIGNYLEELPKDAAIMRRADTTFVGVQNQDYYDKDGILKMMKASLVRPITDNLSSAASKENVAKTMIHKEEKLGRTIASYFPALSDEKLVSLTSILKRAINEVSKTQAIDAAQVFLRNDGVSAADKVKNERNNLVVAGSLILKELYKNSQNASSTLRDDIEKIANVVGKMLQNDEGKQELKSFITTTLTDNVYSNAVSKRIYNSAYSNPLDEVSKVSKKMLTALTSDSGLKKREEVVKDLLDSVKGDGELKKFMNNNLGASINLETAVNDVTSKIKSRNENLINEMNQVEGNIVEKTGQKPDVYYTTTLLTSQISEVIGTGNELSLYQTIVENIAASGKTKVDVQMETAAKYLAEHNHVVACYLDEARSRSEDREVGYNADAYPITPWPSLARLASEIAKNPNMTIEANTVMDSLMRCAPNDEAPQEMVDTINATVRHWASEHDSNRTKVNFAQADMK